MVLFSSTFVVFALGEEPLMHEDSVRTKQEDFLSPKHVADDSNTDLVEVDPYPEAYKFDSEKENNRECEGKTKETCKGTRPVNGICDWIESMEHITGKKEDNRCKNVPENRTQLCEKHECRELKDLSSKGYVFRGCNVKGKTNLLEEFPFLGEYEKGVHHLLSQTDSKYLELLKKNPEWAYFACDKGINFEKTGAAATTTAAPDNANKLNKACSSDEKCPGGQVCGEKGVCIVMKCQTSQDCEEQGNRYRSSYFKAQVLGLKKRQKSWVGMHLRKNLHVGMRR